MIVTMKRLSLLRMWSRMLIETKTYNGRFWLRQSTDPYRPQIPVATEDSHLMVPINARDLWSQGQFCPGAQHKWPARRLNCRLVLYFWALIGRMWEVFSYLKSSRCMFWVCVWKCMARSQRLFIGSGSKNNIIFWIDLKFGEIWLSGFSNSKLFTQCVKSKTECRYKNAKDIMYLKMIKTS